MSTQLGSSDPGEIGDIGMFSLSSVIVYYVEVGKGQPFPPNLWVEGSTPDPQALQMQKDAGGMTTLPGWPAEDYPKSQGGPYNGQIFFGYRWDATDALKSKFPSDSHRDEKPTEEERELKSLKFQQIAKVLLTAGYVFSHAEKQADKSTNPKPCPVFKRQGYAFPKEVLPEK